MICKDCGEQMEGDGYSLAIHCPNVEDITECTPDCNPIYCNNKPDEEDIEDDFKN